MINLRTDSAYPEDQGSGRARLDPETMLQLRISPGDLVFLEGKRKTVAKVWRMMVNDWNQEKIKIDNFTRMNAGISIGDRVSVTPIKEVIPAKRVVLAPPEDLPRQLPINYNSAMSRLIDYPVLLDDSVPVLAGMPFVQPQPVAFKVIYLEPENAVIISRDTEIEFSDKPAAGFEGLKLISYEDIGGLKTELQNVRETIELPMRHPELFSKLGIDPPKGVLLYGPPGTGKTLIAKAVANESGAHFISIAGPEIISKYYGESEQRLREIFDEAEENAPSIIFIDELDSIAPKREDVTGEVERRVVAQLLTMMDGLDERGQVVVIGATNRLDAIDQALRRPGRFDREIEIGVPGEEDRMEILRIHTRGMPIEGENRIIAKKKELKATESSDRGELEEELRMIKDEIGRTREMLLKELAGKTTGFVGADLASLGREAAMRALRRYLPHIDLESDEISPEILESIEILIKDFRLALREISPSAMREVFLEVSHINWRDVGGLDSEKEEVRETVEYPLTKRDSFEELGIEPPKGVLLYGPPGTGKTLIAKAVANESGANFIPVRGPQLLSKWVGESEKAVREVFRKARQVAPAIIFFDELDALAPARGRGSESHVIESVLNQILTEFDGLEDLTGVSVLAATNRPDIIDQALLRAGRFDRLVYIGEPDEKSREKILHIHSRFLPIENSVIENILEITKDFDEVMFEEIFVDIRKKRDIMPNRIITVDEMKKACESCSKKAEKRLPSGKRRKIIIELLSKNALRLDDPARDALIVKIAGKTEGYVGSDLELLCRESAMFAMRDGRNIVGESDFKKALAKVHPMMNENLREQYKNMKSHFKGGRPKDIQPVEYQ
ncbi:CDC48 family AAA ATPase [Methanoplanus endosymbiosus]|uniref:CDC48 family AAA ATPase n=1 Tax=Methanoplanus endosymbiosus TaxID=33865 RepID=A0A9E7THE6_9EURY|nr:CDC48 family AAA ATPase [Methanoplanus endosymbiosus]UUX92727.1 CDC48 family AAA ATPase [Methanoplanus endosymbiosus]